MGYNAQEKSFLATMAPDNVTIDMGQRDINQYQIDTSINTEVSKKGLEVQNSRSVAGIEKDHNQVKANITQLFTDMQNDMRLACEAQGSDFDQLFDRSGQMGNTTEAGLAASTIISAAAGSVFKGAGTLATATAVGGAMKSVADELDGISNPREAKAKAVDLCRQWASEAQSPTAMAKLGTSAPTGFSGTRWDQMAPTPENNALIEAVMMCNPKDPPEDMFPEVAKMNKDQRALDETKANLADVREGRSLKAGDIGEIRDSLSRGDVEGAIAKSAHKPTVGEVKAEATDFVNALLKGPKADPTSLEGASSHTRMFAATFGMEFDPAKMGLNPRQSFTNSMN